MVRATDTNLFPVHDAVSAIADLATGANVENVMINGEFRKRHGNRVYPKDKHNMLRE